MIEGARIAVAAVRLATAFGWLCVVLMAAFGSVHLTCAYPLAVVIRGAGFAMLVFGTRTLLQSLLDIEA